MRSVLAPQVKLHEVWAWSMYDFANSGYTTVVITAVFAAYFVSGVAQKAPWATFAWTLALSISHLFLIIVSNVFYTYGESLTAAFLPELAKPDSLGKVSGWGWSFGYFGGMLTLG